MINKHKNFEHSEIRDLFAKNIIEVSNKSVWCINFEQLNRYEDKLKKAKENFELAKKSFACFKLMKEKNWDNWDVSDYGKYNRDTYFDFIGTEEESKKYIKELNEKKGGVQA